MRTALLLSTLQSAGDQMTAKKDWQLLRTQARRFACDYDVYRCAIGHEPGRGRRVLCRLREENLWVSFVRR
jgi:hypothetical protein